MRILYFTQFYPPEQSAAPFRASENAHLWAAAGHAVTVFTGYPNYPFGKIFEGYTPRLLTEENDGGVRVLRSKLIAQPNTNFMKRVVNACSFLFFALVNIAFNRRRIGKDYDVVLATSGTVFAAMAGARFAKKHRIPLVVEFRDITYRQLMGTGAGEGSLKVKLMRWIELSLCKEADRVVTVTEGFKRIFIADGISEDKISVVTNGVDIGAPTEKDNHTGLCFGYFGTLGISQNIPLTLKYVESICVGNPNTRYLVIGGGAKQQEVSGLIRDRYAFAVPLPAMPAKELEPYYGALDMCIATLQKSDNFRYTLPSKLFQIMGRGIPVLFIGPDGEAAEIVRRHRAGLALTGSEAEDMQALQAFFARDNYAEALAEMGRSGYEAVRTHYSRKVLADNYLALFSQAIGSKVASVHVAG